MRNYKIKNITKYILILFFTISFNIVNGQFIFSAQDLNNFVQQANIDNFGEIVYYFKQQGYLRMPNSDDFKDSYGNIVKINTIEQLPDVFTVTYTIKKPTQTILKNFKEELNGYFSYTNTGGNKFFIINDNCLISFENKPGVSCVLVVSLNRKGGAFIPAKKIDNSHLELTSYRTGTYIKVNQGDKIYMTATGNIVFGGWAGSGGPEGIDGFQSYNKKSEFKHGALLCYIDDKKVYGEPFIKVGTNCSFTAARSGYLRFVINDDDPSNNSGSFVVEYSINKPLVQSIQNQPKTSKNQNSQSNNTSENVNSVQENTNNKPKEPIKNVNPFQKTNSTYNNIQNTLQQSQILLEDYFIDNRSNWDVASKNHIISIKNNRMIYENKEKENKVYSMVGIPISLKNDDNYTIEVSMQCLTPCQNKKVDNLLGIFSKEPKPVFYGFAIGDKEADILFAVGSNIKSRETKDDIIYTCVPSYFITNLIAGNSNYIQDWTKNISIGDGSNVNILKLIKRDGQFIFYINNRLIITKNSFSLSSDNAISIVSSAQSKVSVNYVKIYKN